MRGKQALLNIIATMFELVIVTITGFVVPNYIIRTYGSSVNGLVTSITQFLGYISLIESGIGSIGRASLYKPLAEKNQSQLNSNIKALENFYRKIAYIFILYVLILSFLFPILTNENFDWGYIVTLIVILAFSTFIQYYFGITSQTLIQADQKKHVPSVLQSITLILNMFITIALIEFGASIFIVKIGSAFAYAIRPMILFGYAKKYYKIDKSAKPCSEVLKQRWDGLAHHVAFFIHKNTDIVILTILSSLKDVSVYSVYSLAASGCSKVVNIFSSNFEPAFGNMIAKGEKEVLKSRVNLCSVLTTQITVVIFSTAIIVISPFITLYTRVITDVDYLRPAFGAIILIAEAFYCIRMPYQSVAYANGHFKQTRNGAIVEAILNIVISIFFVFLYGLVGVAIGTLLSMVFRTCQYIWYYHTKLIKEKDGWFFEIKKLLVSVIEIILIFIISYFMPTINSSGYLEWIVEACLIGITCSLCILLLSLVFYKKELSEIMMILKRVIFRRHKEK